MLLGVRYVFALVALSLVGASACGEPKPARSWQELEACLRLYAERPEGFDYVKNFNDFRICLDVSPVSDVWHE